MSTPRETADHTSWSELVIGRSLDALEPGDDARLEAHLPDCAECQTLLVDMTHVASSIAYGAPDAEPPAELLERIRHALPAASIEVSPDARVVLLSDRRRRVPRPARRWVTSVAGLSAAAALVVTGLYAADQHAAGQHARTSLAAESAVIRDLQNGSAYAVPLSAGGPASGAAVVNGRTVDLVTAGLDRNNTASSQYVLWAATGHGQQMLPLRGFDVTSGGVDVVRATLPAGMTAPTVFAVSEERGRTLPTIPGRLVLGFSTAS